MRALNKNLTLLDAIWLYSLYMTFNHYHWVYLAFVIIALPWWNDMNNLLKRKRIESKYRDVINATKKELNEKTRK